MIEQHVIEELKYEYKALDHELIIAITSEYDNEDDARIILNGLNQDALSTPVDWSDFENDVQKQIKELESSEQLQQQQKKENKFDEEDKDINDDVRFLKQSFPDLSIATIKHKLNSCNGDLDKVTDLLLNQTMIDEYVSEDDKYLQNFRTKTANSRQKLKKGEIESQSKDIKYLSEILKISLQQATDMYEANGKSLTKCLLAADGNKAEGGAGNTISSSSSSSSTPITITGSQQRYSAISSSINESQKNADISFERRREAIQQAQQMYRKSHSNPLFRSAAGYYSNIANQHGDDAKDSLNSMHRRMIENRSTRYEVDFHGVPMQIAVEVCHSKLHEWWTRERLNPTNIIPLKLITGTGRHSDGGIPKIKNAVRKLLRENQFKFEESLSYFLVTGSK